MKIICKKNKINGKEEFLEVYNWFYKEEHTYNELHIENTYRVMGTVIYKETNCLKYLIDDGYSPNWYPYLLFDIVDNTLPKNWYVKVHSKNSNYGIYIITGFDELVNNDEFHDLLINRDQETLNTYFKRKIEYEEITNTIAAFKRLGISYSWITIYVGRKIGNISTKEVVAYAEEYLLKNPDCTDQYIVQLVCDDTPASEIDNTILKILKNLKINSIEEGSSTWNAEIHKWRIAHSNNY